jgi:hypothetical protein
MRRLPARIARRNRNNAEAERNSQYYGKPVVRQVPLPAVSGARGVKTYSKPALCVCAKFTGQRLPHGARVDLKCGNCGHRIATDANTVSLHECGLADLRCVDCAAAEGITLHYPR